MTYLAIDLDAGKVIFKTANVTSACLLSALEHSESTHCIFPVDPPMACEKLGARARKIPQLLTTAEMRRIWTNETGAEWPDANVGKLIDALHQYFLDYPIDGRSQFQLEKQAGPVTLSVDAGTPDTLPRHPMVIPAAPKPAVASIPSAPVIPGAPKLPSAPAIPKAPPSAPSTKGATGKVWAIADLHYLTASDDGTQVPDLKALRKQIIAACEAEGINPGTAATQFGKWKSSKGL